MLRQIDIAKRVNFNNLRATIADCDVPAGAQESRKRLLRFHDEFDCLPPVRNFETYDFPASHRMFGIDDLAKPYAHHCPDYTTCAYINCRKHVAAGAMLEIIRVAHTDIDFENSLGWDHTVAGKKSVKTNTGNFL